MRAAPREPSLTDGKDGAGGGLPLPEGGGGGGGGGPPPPPPPPPEGGSGGGAGGAGAPDGADGAGAWADTGGAWLTLLLGASLCHVPPLVHTAIETPVTSLSIHKWLLSKHQCWRSFHSDRVQTIDLIKMNQYLGSTLVDNGELFLFVDDTAVHMEGK